MMHRAARLSLFYTVDIEGLGESCAHISIANDGEWTLIRASKMKKDRPGPDLDIEKMTPEQLDNIFVEGLELVAAAAKSSRWKL